MNSSSWFKQAIIYQIFIDRFAIGGKEKDKSSDDSKPTFSGGNIQGIIENLDHIQDLGANTIWLSPFNSTSAYHGYHVTDFFDVDQHFGSQKILQEFIKIAHSKNIRVIMDFVPNHVSNKHPYFVQAKKDRDSKYHNWFFFNKWPNDYICFLSYKELPKLNLEYLPAREHIIKAAKHWLSLGIDGIRLDHAMGPSFDFWKEFKKQIKKHKPEAVLIGETFFADIEFKHLKTLNIKNKLLTYIRQKLGFDVLESVMLQYLDYFDGELDFVFQNLVKSYIAHPKWYKPEWLLNIKINKHFSAYPDDFYLPSFLDNHDMNRFLYESNQNIDRLKKAARIQFDQKQPAVIYYGTEVGLSQEKDFNQMDSYPDILARKMMPWGNQNIDLKTHFKKLIKEKTK